MDVEAYLKRIRYHRSLKSKLDHPNIDLLRALHCDHLYTVPFENLDIHLGRKIICDETRILHKIVNEHRGGFCYELNGAFAALLRELGFQVTLLSARVAREGGGYGPEFDHLTLRVDIEEPWLADVGFGDSFLEPLRLTSGVEQEQCGRVYRLVSADREWVLEVMAAGMWKPEYAFTLEPRELSDFAAMCLYHQTSPDSHFTRQRICSMATPRGRITLSGDKLIETRGGKRQESRCSRDQEWRAQLKQLFSLVLPD